MLVLVTWSVLVPKPKPIENKEVVEKIALPASTEMQSLKQATAPSPEKLFKFTTDKFEATFDEPSASIKEIKFNSHKNYILPLEVGFLINQSGLVFKKLSETANEVQFGHFDENKKIYKRFIFNKSPYTIELEINVQSETSSPIEISLPIVLGIQDFSLRNIQSMYQEGVFVSEEKTQHIKPRKDTLVPDLKFLALRDRYYCVIMEPEKAQAIGFIKTIDRAKSEIGLEVIKLNVPANGQIGQLFHIYVGPQDVKLINSVKPGWSTIIHYGAFDIISQILLQLLGFFYSLVHNWGMAIIMLSFTVYLVLFPLTLKQMRSMKEMQMLQPKIEALRNEYKDNPQKLNKEIMELYREHKVNPLGGCLPLLLQMPIFLALYQALMRSIALKGAHFLWIKDLSEPDKLFVLSKNLPIIANEVNILPILMAIGMFIQQKTSMPAATSSSAEQQKIMMILMPILFGFIFYHMPAGLVLYWFVNSTLMLIYQIRISRAK